MHLLHHPVARMLLIAAAYVVTGKLGLMLAIPPGYASAVWPPSGIALGALLVLGVRCWPGVALGSVLTNVATLFDASTNAALASSLMLASCVGLGAAAQAVIGVKLIERTIGLDTQLVNEREVFRFLAWGGPVACLVNASIGVAALTAFGAIPPSAAAYSWWTWWVGDSIGVLIFAPLVLMWLDGTGVWRTRRWLVTLPLLATFTCAVLVFVYSSRAEWRELNSRFNDDANRIAAEIERRIELNQQALRSIASLFDASSEVTREEFVRFTAPILADRPDLHALAWAPRVAAAEHPAITDPPAGAGVSSAAGRSEPLITAPARERFPIQYFQSLRGLGGAGFDLSSEPERRLTLERARQSGDAAASALLKLRPGQSARADGFMLALPTYGESSALGTSRAPLLGYAIAWFNIEEFVRDARIARLAGKRMSFVIDDVADPAHGTRIFELHPDSDRATNLALEAITTVEVGGRMWRMTFTPTLDYLAGGEAIVAWLVLAAGLLLSSLVGAGALILTGRTAEIQKLVHARTEELAVINEKLSVEICDHLSTEAQLKHERAFLKMVLDNLKEGIMVFDRDGHMTLTNAAARSAQNRIVGAVSDRSTWTQHQVLCYPDGVTAIPLEELPRSRALRGEFVDDFEMVAVAPNRTPANLLVTSRPMLDADGKAIGALTLFRDITESRQAERLKREFVSVVSHELRTPLTSIRASLGLMQGGAAGALPDKAQHLLELAYRNTDRLAHLINDILDIEKIESGKLSLELAMHSLREIVDQALAANAGYAQSCGVRFVFAGGDEDARVCIDANRLLQVLANLLSNAAKFSPADSAIEVGLVRSAESVRIYVRDRGPGVPEEFRPRIFQKFSQADGSDARAKPGTGLGLAISKALIERMGGVIGFDSMPGQGATFYFDLPLADDASQSAA